MAAMLNSYLGNLDRVPIYIDENETFQPNKHNKIFNPQSIEDIKKLSNRLHSHSKRVGKCKDKVIAEGYNPNYGARPLKRYVQKTVETLAAKLILSGNVSEGDTITIDVDENGFTAR